MAIETTTAAVACDCPEPPADETQMLCNRHQCTKSHAMWVKCQTDPAWWRAWEEGRGPRQHAADREPRPDNGRLSSGKSDLTPVAERLAEETGDPSIIEKLGNYRRALQRWMKAGFPTREDNEVERIHADHCVPCEKYDAERQVCRTCGCGVKGEGVAAFNKIKMATEKCPLRKW